MGSKAIGIGAYRSAEVLLRWNVVERDEKGRYKKNGWAIRGLHSYTWRGKSGRVVSIELAEGAFRETKRTDQQIFLVKKSMMIQ
jgi:hypothetical protein